MIDKSLRFRYQWGGPGGKSPGTSASGGTRNGGASHDRGGGQHQQAAKRAAPVTTAKAPPSILSRDTKPVTTAKAPPSILARDTKPKIDTGPKKDILPEFKKRKTIEITGGNPFLKDPYEKKIVYEPREGPARPYDPRTAPNALLKRPGGILSTIGGIGKKVFGDSPLEIALNLGTMGGFKGAKYAKAALDLKNRKGKYGTALKFFEDKTGKKLSLASTQHLKNRPKDMPEHLGERGFKIRDDTSPRDGKDSIAKQVAGDENVIAKYINQFAGTEVEGQIQSLVQNNLNKALQYYASMHSRIEKGYSPDRQEMDVFKLLEHYLNQAAPKQQGAAYGGRIDKALGGRVRDI